MQLSRIKKMSGKRKKEWLNAIDELEKDYRSNEPLQRGCPLCHVVVCTGCRDCLWTIIEGCSCGDYEWGDDHRGIPEIWMGKYFKEWKIHRLKMLDIWKKVITIYIVIDSIGEIFKDIGKDFREVAEKLRPLGEAIEKANEAVEKIEKKGGNNE